MRTNTTPRVHLSGRFVPLFLCLLLTGCVDTDYLLLTQSPPPRITPKSPVALLDAPPPRHFIKLAMVEASQTGGFATWEELRKALVDKATELNADAVIELTTGSETSGGLVGTPSMN